VEEAGGGKKKKGIGVNFKVSAKGAVSVYGLGRFPVTLYREQWLRLLERTDDLRKFMEEHADELKAKGDQSPTSVQDTPIGEPIVGSAGADAQESVADLASGPRTVSEDRAQPGPITTPGVGDTDSAVEDASAFQAERAPAAARDAEGNLNPGTKAVDATGDVGYGDDYPEKPTDPWRPGGY
jgi:hypothetical protein